jgi:Predicted membrane protein
LGLALALDAFGAGIGLAMTGLNILYTALSVGVVQLVLVNAGIGLGKSLRAERYQHIAAIVPGFILVGIGFLSFCKVGDYDEDHRSYRWNCQWQKHSGQSPRRIGGFSN